MDLLHDPRRRPALVAAALALVAVALLVVVAVRGLTGAPECEVTVGDRTVDLTTAQAESAAGVSARSVRSGLSLPATSTAVARAAGLSAADAGAVASALTGRSRHALTCTHGGADETESDRLDRHGLTHRAEHVRLDLDQAFGHLPDGGFAPGGVRSGHMPGSAHYEGRAVDVFVRPISPRNKAKGWAVAQYLVANAERLEIDTVIFDARIWTARRAEEGWRVYLVSTSGRSRDTVRILEHRDHVHVDVAD
jgi:RES domain-containing protein